MLNVCLFLQSVCKWLEGAAAGAFRVTKRMYRSSAVIAAGSVVLAVTAFTASGFSGGGRNVLTAYAETDSGESEPEAMKKVDELTDDVEITEAKIQIRFDSPEELREGQILAGDTLAKEVQARRRVWEVRREATEQAKEEIRQIEEERIRAMAGEAGEIPDHNQDTKKAKQEDEREAGSVSAEIRCSSQEYELLKRIVEAEAGICDTKGRILVANVILNRVRSDEFPDTITEVVYQKSQFSPVTDGRLYTCEVTQQTAEAVDRALAGEDYSQGAVYFMNRGGSKSRNVSWFDSRLTYLFQHDRHEFFR